MVATEERTVGVMSGGFVMSGKGVRWAEANGYAAAVELMRKAQAEYRIAVQPSSYYGSQSVDQLEQLERQAEARLTKLRAALAEKRG